MCTFFKNRTFLTVLLINVSVFLILMLLFEPTQKSDDLAMSMVLYGCTSGEPSPYLAYSNVLMGKFLVSMIKIFPQIAWYWVTYFLLMFISFLSISYILMKNRGSEERYILLTFFLLVSGYVFFVRCTFTKVSGLCLMAGLLLIFHAIDVWGKKYLYYILGSLLVICGVLIRTGMLLPMLAVFFGGFLIWVYCAEKNKQLIKKMICFFLIVIGIVCAQFFFDNYNYREWTQTDEMKQFLDNNSLRGSIQDYPILEYSQNKNEYAKRGISENDYIMLQSTPNQIDFEVYTDDYWRTLLELKKKGDNTLRILGKSIKGFPQYVFSTILGLVLVGITVLISIERKKGGVIAATIVWTLIFAMYMYLAFLGRLQNHVDECLFAAGSIILLYLANFDNVKKCMPVIVFMAVLIIIINYSLIISPSYYGSLEMEGFKSQRECCMYRRKGIEILSEDTKHLYMVPGIEGNRSLTVATPFEADIVGLFHNILPINTTIYASGVKEVLEEYEVENPFREAIDSDTILFVVSDKYEEQQMNNILNYMREHYNSQTQMKRIKEVNDLNIYRFFSY